MHGYDRLYVEFLYYFNIDRDYFECHEVMEELWMEEGRNPLLQGLLQVAVSLHHFRNNNRSGATKLFTAALDKLEPYETQALGIDLDRLREESKEYLFKLAHWEDAPFDFYDLDIVIVDTELADLVEELRENPPVKSEH